MSKANVFVKLGGSFITDKNIPDSLSGPRIVAAARAIREALDGGEVSVVLGHGAGSYGHILAKKYDAVKGIHPNLGWEGFYRIRESMAEMNARFVRHCGEGGLFPATVRPLAVAAAAGGKVVRIDAHNISLLLESGQTPLIHGDIIPDSEWGFTIASTEALLTALAEHLRFDRVVMVGDTPGVLDAEGRTIETLDLDGMDAIADVVVGASSPDVTGGMRRKVESLLSLLASERVHEARIISFADDAESLRSAILGTGGGGTLIR